MGPRQQRIAAMKACLRPLHHCDPHRKTLTDTQKSVSKIKNSKWRFNPIPKYLLLLNYSAILIFQEIVFFIKVVCLVKVYGQTKKKVFAAILDSWICSTKSQRKY
jgi:hypothetical protein